MKRFLLTTVMGITALLLLGCSSSSLEPVEVGGFAVEVIAELQMATHAFTREGELIEGSLEFVELDYIEGLGIQIPERPDLETKFILELIDAEFYDYQNENLEFTFEPQESTTGTFDAIKFTDAGTFTFAIRQSTETDGSWEIDHSVFEIVITVTEDVENERLVANASNAEARFVNVWIADMSDEILEVLESQSTTITVQFVGDVFLHRGPIEAARTNAGTQTFDFRPFLTHIRSYIDGDLTIANMETPVDVLGDNRDITTFPLFNAPFEILEALDYAGFQHLNTANNHSFDRHWGGILATVENIERAGLTQTGMYVDAAAREIPTIFDINGIRVGMVSYTDSVNGLDNFVSAEQREFAVRRFRSHVIDDVPSMLESANWLREQGAEVVIMSLHWGAEYVDNPTQMQREIARALVEGGVDIIMGKHSHSPQPVEWHYREDGTRGFIMYSLGNFLADQTRLNPPDNRTQFGILATVQITHESNGEIRLTNADILPTLTMRDFNGNVLRHRDDVTVLPVIEGQIPEQFTNQMFRDWGNRAYNHLTRIVGEEFITRRHGVELFYQSGGN